MCIDCIGFVTIAISNNTRGARQPARYTTRTINDSEVALLCDDLSRARGLARGRRKCRPSWTAPRDTLKNVLSMEGCVARLNYYERDLNMPTYARSEIHVDERTN